MSVALKLLLLWEDTWRPNLLSNVRMLHPCITIFRSYVLKTLSGTRLTEKTRSRLMSRATNDVKHRMPLLPFPHVQRSVRTQLKQLHPIGIPIKSRAVEDESPDVRNEELFRLFLFHVFEAKFGKLLQSISRPSLSSLFDAVQHFRHWRVVRTVLGHRYWVKPGGGGATSNMENGNQCRLSMDDS